MRVAVLLSATLALLVPVDLSAAKPPVPRPSATALKQLTPAGYRVAVALLCDADPGGVPEFLVALSDLDEESPSKTVTLLLVRGDHQPVVEDSVLLHSEPPHPGDRALAPNYCFGVSRQNVGAGDLFLVTSRGAWGGSGAINYFDFFRPENHKLRLVKSFQHPRMESYYFTVFENAAYDAEVQCVRGEKHGNAYVYTCWLQVTKFLFNGTDLLPVASERMREQKGNRFLKDQYWFISLKRALQNREVFASGH
jgi:hypothetical protein